MKTYTAEQRLEIYYKVLGYFEFENRVWDYPVGHNYSIKILCLCFALSVVSRIRYNDIDMHFEILFPELYAQKPEEDYEIYVWFRCIDFGRDDARCECLYKAIELVYKENPELYD